MKIDIMNKQLWSQNNGDNTNLLIGEIIITFSQRMYNVRYVNKYDKYIMILSQTRDFNVVFGKKNSRDI